MKKYCLFLALGMAGAVYKAQAQVYAADAARYSSLQVAGTARMQAIGGAATALGGDISAAYYNPAGLGFNRKSEFSFAPALNFLNTDASYLGNTDVDSKLNFNISHLGLALSFPKDGDGDFKGGTFAISMTRNNNFSNSTTYSAKNNNSSIVDFFISNSEGVPEAALRNQLASGAYELRALAYDAYATYFAPQTDNQGNVTRNLYNSDIPLGAYQRERIVQSGGQYQVNASYGGNYKDLLYFGAGIGFHTFSFEQTKTFTERTAETVTFRPNSLQTRIFNNLSLTENLRQDISGISLQAGVIVRPLDFLRVGVNIISPTWMSASENYNASLTVNYNNYVVDNKSVNNVKSSTPELPSDFSITTPMRLSGGIAAIIGKHGFLSADVEYVDFRTMKLSADFDMSSNNTAIRNMYRSVINIRTGAEFRIDKFRLRGGFAYYPDNKVNSNFNTMSISGGVGYMTKKIYIDFAVVNITSKSAYTPYTVTESYRSDMKNLFNFDVGATPTATFNNSQVRAIATMGFFF